jgi:hypothetical protein
MHAGKNRPAADLSGSLSRNDALEMLFKTQRPSAAEPQPKASNVERIEPRISRMTRIEECLSSVKSCNLRLKNLRKTQRL